ncbi:hypothetical protein H2198_003558 [Neophaeococcomyces mojaviensis]|uniref:Uncharacterized protein n=1 Tax=Neophaeococcomyces mojaviensis TaxID=3383035 RepID=A0ACC3ABG7_9EURO|nr:hypothetical protein H2198_003558 [Knufia sp. JES_112]
MLSHSSLLLCFATAALAVTPSAIYDGGFNSTEGTSNSSIALRIGNGGAGQSGLVKDAFIADSVANGSDPFQVAWITSDTTYSIKYLGTGDIDVGITYSPVAEQIAINQSIALSPSYYAFRDHFLLVGPPSNPANLTSSSDILSMFSQLHSAAEAAYAAGASAAPVRFLSRFDKSATNIKDSQLFINIGQVPWATAYSTWYHQYIAFPIQALTAAITLGEYTITDRGTWLSLPTNLTQQATIYKAGSDDADDLLLNPAHLLVGKKAQNPKMAQAFADWVVSAQGGQKVISAFTKNGQVLYSKAP